MLHNLFESGPYVIFDSQATLLFAMPPARMPLLDERDGAGIAIDGNSLATRDPPRSIPGAHDSGNTIFPSDNGSVGKNSTDIGHQTNRLGKKWRPSWGRCGADKYRIWFHRLEVIR